MSDDPVARHLVDVALERIERDGMSVGLDHLSLERIIAESGVSRATAYRRWPNKQAFLAEVLRAAVQRTHLIPEQEEDLTDLVALLDERGDLIKTPQGRVDIVIEALRLAAQGDFDRTRTSPRWQTYFALTATCQGLPTGELRDSVQTALAATTREFRDRRAQIYRGLALLGALRPVAHLGEAAYEVMSSAAGTLMAGMVVTSYADPGLATRTFRTAAWGSREVRDWTYPAHHLVGVLLAHLEPDPTADLDRDWLLSEVRRYLLDGEPPRRVASGS